jgi:uncharacterized membrane protein
MSDLVAIAFPAEAKAEEVRQKLVTMQKKHLIDLGDAVIALKERDGHIKLDRLINTSSAGTAVDTFWGTLIDDNWMKETAAAIKPGTAALFALVRKFTANKVLDALGSEGGTILKTSLGRTTEAALQAPLAGGAQAVTAVASQVEHTDVDPDVRLLLLSQSGRYKRQDGMEAPPNRGVSGVLE